MGLMIPLMLAPAKRPCGTCPYRRDVPSGVWDEEEYEKLPEFDRSTQAQPPSVFMCHQQDGHLCAGWAGCHDMDNSLGLRMAAVMGRITPEEFDKTLDYVSPVPLFETGQQAAEHGRAAIDAPDPKARKAIATLTRKRAAKKGTRK